MDFDNKNLQTIILKQWYDRLTLENQQKFLTTISNDITNHMSVFYCKISKVQRVLCTTIYEKLYIYPNDDTLKQQIMTVLSCNTNVFTFPAFIDNKANYLNINTSFISYTTQNVDDHWPNSEFLECHTIVNNITDLMNVLYNFIIMNKVLLMRFVDLPYAISFKVNTL